MSEESGKEIQSLTTCQNCGANDPNLVSVDTGLKLALAKTGRADVPSHICKNCLKELRSSASLGVRLQAKDEAKKKNTTELWNNRIQLIRTGRLSLNMGDYAAAAVAYEKYIKVLCLALEKDKSELEPKLFSRHPKEITILSSILWDLMLIYDSQVQFRSKQMEVAEMLARFLRFSPVYNAIIRKAELEMRKSKNPQAYRQLLKLCDAQTSRCFVANAAFMNSRATTVVELCAFRDLHMKKSHIGRKLVCLYYYHSPSWAQWMDNHPQLKPVARLVLRGVAILLKAIFHLPVQRDS